MSRREAGSAGSAGVALWPVDEAVLDRLVEAALSGAAPDEVTPPVGAGTRWSPERVEWLRRFHRDRRPGLGGPQGEATWAVAAGDAVVGAVRLKRTRHPEVLETGIWLIRDARGKQIGRRAMSGVLERARALGARQVRAETSAGHAAARGLLEALGFRCATDGDRVTAVLDLG